MNKALAIQPDFIVAWQAKNEALSKKLEKYQEIIWSCEQLIKILPEHCEAWIWKGASLENLEMYQDAILSHNRAIEINPDCYEAWGFKGRILYRMQNYKEATICFNKALSIEPGYELAQVLLALISLKTKNLM